MAAIPRERSSPATTTTTTTVILRPKARPPWRLLAVVLLLLAAVGAALAVLGGTYRAHPLAAAPSAAPGEEEAAARLRRRLESLQPRGIYLVVDTYGNRLRVYRGGELLREAVCSTGSGVLLRDPRDGRIWVFDTPIGERRIQRKVRNPVWAKPDWAFIEEGYLPPKDPAERFDSFSLGDYGLYLGDGYIIHGTIFQTLLGQPVTHGCVRLGDQDLEYVYRHLPLGGRVYLY